MESMETNLRRASRNAGNKAASFSLHYLEIGRQQLLTFEVAGT